MRLCAVERETRFEINNTAVVRCGALRERAVEKKMQCLTKYITRNGDLSGLKRAEIAADCFNRIIHVMNDVGRGYRDDVQIGSNACYSTMQ